MNPTELLTRTADVLEERGHVRYKLETGDGRVCLMGAMGLAATGDAVWAAGGAIGCYSDVVKEATEALLAEVDVPPTVGSRYLLYRVLGTPEWWLAAVDWNNEDERTGEEIVVICRRAAGRLLDG